LFEAVRIHSDIIGFNQSKQIHRNIVTCSNKTISKGICVKNITYNRQDQYLTERHLIAFKTSYLAWLLLAMSKVLQIFIYVE